jgi:hypothetical protein
MMDIKICNCFSLNDNIFVCKLRNFARIIAKSGSEREMIHKKVTLLERNPKMSVTRVSNNRLSAKCAAAGSGFCGYTCVLRLNTRLAASFAFYASL